MGKVDRIKTKHQDSGTVGGTPWSPTNSISSVRTTETPNPTVRSSLTGYHSQVFLLAGSSLLASITSDQSVEDISNLQLKGTTPASLAPHISPPSTSAEILHSKQSTVSNPDTETVKHKPTKPILKNRTQDYSVQGRLQARDGNWYTNPLDTTYYHSANYTQVGNSEQRVF